MNSELSLADQRSQLRRVHILADLTEAELDELSAALTWRNVAAGEKVIGHLDADTHVYFAINGMFQAHLESAAGRQVAIRDLPAGTHFGEIAALTATPRSVTVLAETAGLVAVCPIDAFRALMVRNGVFASAVAGDLARKVVALTDRVFELSTLELRFRVYAELLRMAAHGETTELGVLIKEAPRHEAIAAAIGAQREAVNRELRALVANGVIQQNKRELLIRDIEQLRCLLRSRAGPTTSEALGWRY